MPAPTNKELSEHRQFLQREKVYEKRYARQFYKWIQDADRAAATAYANGEDWQLAIQDITPVPIYERLYMQATIDEARREYRRLVPEAEIKQKDLIDDLTGILSSGERGNLITLWRGLLGDFLNIRIASRITEVTNTTRRRIASLIEQSLNEGLGAEETAKRIRNDQKYSRNRSLAIARTETITALNQGKYLAAFSSPYVSEKKWLPTIDDRTRASHADFYDRPWIDLEAIFWVANADGVLEPAQYPCDKTLTASNVVNCYLPDTMINGNIKSAQRSFYSGQVIEIITRNGKRLTVTPNHGILTDNGFVPAKSLKIGYNLICNSEQVKGIFRLIDNYIQKKFTSANIFSSFNILFSSKEIMSTALDFDGDGKSINGNVNIVDAERSLMCRRISNVFKRINNFFFKKSRFKGVNLCGFSPFYFFRSWNNSTYRRLMSFLILSFPLCFRHIVPFNFFSLGLVSKLNIIRFKNSIDDATRDTVFLRELINTNTIKIGFDDIINIRKFNYSGHVYDFSSNNGVNIANNIYTSNCRCSIQIRSKRGPDGRLIRKNIEL